MAAAKGNKYAQKWTPDKIEELIEELLDFAANARSIHLAKFCRMKGYSKKWLGYMSDQYQEMADAVDEAKELLSAKILDSSVYADDPTFRYQPAMEYLPVYDKSYRDFLKWKAEIAKTPPPTEETGPNSYDAEYPNENNK